VRSALAQTWPNLEVLVVVDGPDPASAARLACFGKARVRVVYLNKTLGGAEARNVGVRAARGEWIAFLDDDDAWLPEKIERQMRAVREMHEWFPVVSSRVIARSPTSRRILPVHAYQPAQPIADFLFCREKIGDSGGVMQCSTLLAPRDLLLAIPFQAGLPLHQDWDWLIRVSEHEGVGFSMLREPLSIWRVEDGRTTAGGSPDWQFSLAWIRNLRPLISRRAFSWFVAVECAWRAQTSRAGLRVRLKLLRALLVEGRAEPASVLNFLIFSLVPERLRRMIRRHFLRQDPGCATGTGLRLVHTRPSGQPLLRKRSL
jgi:glycosyltransferase involved in cell wall biosynthesis